MTPEEELREELLRQYSESVITVESSSATYFEALQRSFPVHGSKIDWNRVPEAQIRRSDTANSEQYFDEVSVFVQGILEAELLDPEGDVVVIGDSAMEGAFKMPLLTLKSCLRSILRMPQHTYVFDLDVSWCLAFTMEGDLCFGYSPRAEPHRG